MAGSWATRALKRCLQSLEVTPVIGSRPISSFRSAKDGSLVKLLQQILAKEHKVSVSQIDSDVKS